MRLLCATAIFTSCKVGSKYIDVFPKIGVPQNGWFIMENPIKMDDLGVPYRRVRVARILLVALLRIKEDKVHLKLRDGRKSEGVAGGA